MPQREPTKAELDLMNQELATTDSEGLPSSVVSQRVYSVPLAYELSLETDDTLDGGAFRIPIELEPGSTVIVTLTPNQKSGIVTIRVLTSISTTPSD